MSANIKNPAPQAWRWRVTFPVRVMGGAVGEWTRLVCAPDEDAAETTAAEEADVLRIERVGTGIVKRLSFDSPPDSLPTTKPLTVLYDGDEAALVIGDDIEFHNVDRRDARKLVELLRRHGCRVEYEDPF